MPIKQRIEFSLLKLVHHALYAKSLPKYLHIKAKKPTRELHNSGRLHLEQGKCNDTLKNGSTVKLHW